MPLCDTLLRFAEEPAFFCIFWGPKILEEVSYGLRGPRFGYTEQQVSRRLDSMRQAFPEACVVVPDGFIDGIHGLPDPEDRHVVAAAICSHANAIVTENLKHFPAQVMSSHGILVQSADDFPIHRFHLNPLLALDKLDTQAAAIKKEAIRPSGTPGKVCS
ncbi:MAG: PIN domain-containing protein [Acidobacteriaceae bacterium]